MVYDLSLWEDVQLTNEPTRREVELVVAEAERVVRHAESVQLQLPVVGLALIFQERRLYRGPESDWLLLPARRDPMVRNGGLPVPRDARRRLERLASSGVRVPAVFVAHELPHGGLARLARQDAREQDLASGRFAVLGGRESGQILPTATPTKLAVAIAEAADRAAAAMAQAVVTTGRGVSAVLSELGDLASAGSGLDPIIFGAITADGVAEPGDLAAWAVLARWDW